MPSMTLDRYLSEQKLTQHAFAKRIGVTQSRVSRILSGGTVPGRLLQRIYEATDGAVTPNDFISVEPKAAPQAAE